MTVVRLPTLASGRRASCHMWGDLEDIHKTTPAVPNVAGDGTTVKSVMQGGFLGRDTENLFPYGIYT